MSNPIEGLVSMLSVGMLIALRGLVISLYFKKKCYNIQYPMELCTSGCCRFNSLTSRYSISFETVVSFIISILLVAVVVVVISIVVVGCLLWSLLSSEVECPVLAAPDRGLVSMTTRSIGSLAEYSCDVGFRILGPEQRTCLQNGTWSDEDPVCECKNLHQQ